MDCKFPLNGTNFVKCEWCEVLHRPCEKAAHLEICSSFWKSKCKDPEMRSLVMTACRWCGKRSFLFFIQLDILLINYFARIKLLTNIFRIQLQNELEHFDNCALRWKKKYDQLNKARLSKSKYSLRSNNSNF